MNDPTSRDELSQAQQEALRQLRSGGGDCPAVEDLLAAVETAGGDPLPEGLQTHLLTCPFCREMVDRLQAEEPELEEAEWDLIASRLDRRPLPWREPPRGWSGRVIVPIAAALLLAVLLSAFWFMRQPATELEAGFRGSPIQQLEPSGDITRLPVFRWNAPAAALLFRVTVEDARGDVVWSGETRGQSIFLPAEASALFRPGGDYRWQVSGVDSEGRVLAESGWLLFSLAE